MLFSREELLKVVKEEVKMEKSSKILDAAKIKIQEHFAKCFEDKKLRPLTVKDLDKKNTGYLTGLINGGRISGITVEKHNGIRVVMPTDEWLQGIEKGLTTQPKKVEVKK